MQKQLLLFCMVVNCVGIYANESETVSQKEYTEYTKEQEELYQAALVKALCGVKDAIENKDKENFIIIFDDISNELKDENILFTIGSLKIYPAQLVSIALIIFLTYTNTRGIKGG